MRQVQRNVLKTKASMFRYGSDSNEVDERKCKENEILQRYFTSFKVFEGFGALFSLSAVILVMIFWGVTEFNILTSPHDARRMKSDWTLYGATWTPQATTWDDAFYKDRTKVKTWLDNTEYFNLLHSPNKDQQITTLMRSYDTQPKYPAIVWLYDVASIRQNTETSLQTEQSILNLVEETPPPGQTPSPSDLILMQNTVTQMYFTPYQQFRRSLHDQCKSNYGLDLVFTEQWNDQTLRIVDTTMNSYKINMWAILIVIYLTSFLFQAWRVYEYGKEYRPLGPDGLRWIEYGITSPLMLGIITISAGIRSINVFVLLIFVQVALIAFGYMLELLQNDYITWSKYRFLADKTGFSQNSSVLQMNLNMESNGDGDSETEPLKSANESVVLDDFIDVISKSGCGNSNFNLLGSIGKISSSKRFVIDFLYFIAFTLCGVTWTVILVHLTRFSYTQNDCQASSISKIPFIVWFIVISQMLFFFAFGAVSAMIWYSIRSNTSNLMLTNESKKSALENYKKSCFNVWVRGSYMYCLLNIVVKTSLEISIFVFVSLYKAQVNSIPEITQIYNLSPANMQFAELT